MVQGGLLAALFGGFKIDPVSKLLLLLIGAILVFLVCHLALRDHEVGTAYQNRIREFEKSVPAYGYESGNEKFKYPEFSDPKHHLCGKCFIQSCAWLLTLGNVCLAMVQVFLLLLHCCGT